MDKIVTIRMDRETYGKIQNIARKENRPISNFIETATLRYIEEIEFIDDVELAGILSNEELVKKLKQGYRDKKAKRGKFIE